MISLWFVTLVLAPLLALRDPLRNTGTVQVCLLGVLAVVASTLRDQPLDLKPVADIPPLTAALVTASLLLWAHPDRSQLAGLS